VQQPPQLQSPRRGAVQLPAELFLWVVEWPRWQGTPSDIQAVAERMVKIAKAPFPAGARASTILTIATSDKWAGGPTRVEDLAAELEARRDRVTIVSVEVLVYAYGQSYPNIRAIPTRRYQRPRARHISSVAALPVHIAIDFQRDGPGARLEVRSPTGLSGEHLASSLRPHIEARTRKRVPRLDQATAVGAGLGGISAAAAIGLGPVNDAAPGILLLVAAMLAGAASGRALMRWMFPALELTGDGQRTRSRTFAVVAGWVLSLLLGLAGLVVGLR
jgi:hypothetical protein